MEQYDGHYKRNRYIHGTLLEDQLYLVEGSHIEVKPLVNDSPGLGILKGTDVPLALKGRMIL